MPCMRIAHDNQADVFRSKHLTDQCLSEQLQMCLSLPIPVSSAKALLFGLGTFASQAHCKTNFRLPHLSPRAHACGLR